MSIPAGFFEKAYAIWADRAEAKRQGIAAAPPVVKHSIKGIKSDRWKVISEAMGDRWMTARAIARKTDLRIEEVQEAFYRACHRGKWEKRVLACRNGAEWRLKSRELGVKG